MRICTNCGADLEESYEYESIHDTQEKGWTSSKKCFCGTWNEKVLQN